jgi:photosynthetic reaction center cytochrome c subunit
MGQQSKTGPNNKATIFAIVFLLITAVLAGGAWSLLVFINSQVRLDEVSVVPEVNELSPIYVNHYLDVESIVSGDSYLAMGSYAQENPVPQNVQVLTGMTTHEINGYMLNHFVAGLGVNCTYCHSLENFALEEWGDTEEANAAEHNRWVARQHLLMSQDLNQNWLTMLPDLTEDKQPSGVQITCSTCHLGQAQFNTYTEQRRTLPADFRLPLDENVVYSVEEQGYLNVNARTDVSLDATQFNQYVMYHMNYSMNVGCTHCHNSRYFPSYEVPAKYYSMQMLQMTQHIHNEWSDVMIVSPDDDTPGEASCLMCHHEAVIPPGAAKNVDVLGPALVPEGSQSDNAAWGQFQGDTGDWIDAASLDRLRNGNVAEGEGYGYDPTDPVMTGYDPDAETTEENASSTDSE